MFSDLIVFWLIRFVLDDEVLRKMSVNRIYSFKSKKKFIDKRLKYLREQLKTIKKRDIFYTTSNLLDEQQTKNNQEYEKRVHHLLNLYDKQVDR